MNNVNLFVENAWNIAVGIGTGIISSIFVSKIFLIYQDVKNDFIEIVRNTTALELCRAIYQCYANPKLAKEQYFDKPLSREKFFVAVDERVLAEVEQLHGIYTKYMDKKLVEIKTNHEKALIAIHSECNGDSRREDFLLSAFLELEKALEEYDKYRDGMYCRTLVIIIKDKMVICLLILFIAMIIIA